MKKLSFLLSVGCGLLAVGLLSACTFQTEHRGYIFPNDIESKLPAIATTADLERELGSPSVKTVNGDPVWIYYGVDESYRGPLPLSYDNKRVLLAWTDGARVTKTKFLKDKDLPDVDLCSDATPIPAEIQLNMFEELIKNVGRFSPAGMGQ